MEDAQCSHTNAQGCVLQALTRYVPVLSSSVELRHVSDWLPFKLATMNDSCESTTCTAALASTQRRRNAYEPFWVTVMIAPRSAVQLDVALNPMFHGNPGQTGWLILKLTLGTTEVKSATDTGAKAWLIVLGGTRESAGGSEEEGREDRGRARTNHPAVKGYPEVNKKE